LQHLKKLGKDAENWGRDRRRSRRWRGNERRRYPEVLTAGNKGEGGPDWAHKNSAGGEKMRGNGGEPEVKPARWAHHHRRKRGGRTYGIALRNEAEEGGGEVFVSMDRRRTK